MTAIALIMRRGSCGGDHAAGCSAPARPWSFDDDVADHIVDLFLASHRPDGE
jgi:hypothetical protein